jgi:hypothetical protein
MVVSMKKAKEQKICKHCGDPIRHPISNKPLTEFDSEDQRADGTRFYNVRYLNGVHQPVAIILDDGLSCIDCHKGEHHHG